MSLLYRNGTGRNNIAWGGSTSTAANYLRRTGTGRNNISYLQISTDGTHNILNRTASGRNNISWINTTFSFRTEVEINADGFFGIINSNLLFPPGNRDWNIATDNGTKMVYRNGRFTKHSNYYIYTEIYTVLGSQGGGSGDLCIRINNSGNRDNVVNQLKQYIDKIIATKVSIIYNNYTTTNMKVATVWKNAVTHDAINIGILAYYTNPNGTTKSYPVSYTDPMYFK